MGFSQNIVCTILRWYSPQRFFNGTWDPCSLYSALMRWASTPSELEKRQLPTGCLPIAAEVMEIIAPITAVAYIAAIAAIPAIDDSCYCCCYLLMLILQLLHWYSLMFVDFHCVFMQLTTWEQWKCQMCKCWCVSIAYRFDSERASSFDILFRQLAYSNVSWEHDYYNCFINIHLFSLKFIAFSWTWWVESINSIGFNCKH